MTSEFGYARILLGETTYDVQPTLRSLAHQELRKVGQKWPTDTEIIKWLRENGATFTRLCDAYYTVVAYKW